MKASFSVAVPLTEEPVFRKLTKLRFRLTQNNDHGHWAILVKKKCVEHILPLKSHAKFYPFPTE